METRDEFISRYKNSTHSVKRANNDENGNPRVILHFFIFLSKSEKSSDMELSEKYELARKRANSIGFRVYRGKDFGGGFVGQSFWLTGTLGEIYDLINEKP